MENMPKDPVMLLSFVNMKLRDNYSSKEQMMEDMSLSEDDWRKIEERLSSIDYHYQKDMNKFV